MIPVKEFHLVHAVKFKNFEKILASDSLLSISKAETNTSSYFSSENEFFKELNEKVKYDKKIFTGLIMPNENGIPNFTIENVDTSMIYLILNPKLVKDYAECSSEKTDGSDVSFPHYCNEWNWGGHSGCIKYDKKKSLKSNLNIWRQSYLEIRQLRMNKLNKQLNSRRKGPLYVHTRSDFNTPLNEITIQFSKNKEGQCIESEIPLSRYLQAIYIHRENPDTRFFHELATKYSQYKWIFG